MAKDIFFKERVGEKEIIIRGVRLTDAQGLIDLEVKLSKETRYLLSETDEINTDLNMQENHLRDIINSDKKKYFVALADHRLVGFLIIVVQDMRRIAHVGNFIIGVAQDYQGLGIAKHLMEAMLDWAQKKGLKRVELDVLEENIAAVGLYKKFGFEIEGKKIGDYYVDGRYLNTLIMGRAL